MQYLQKLIILNYHPTCIFTLTRIQQYTSFYGWCSAISSHSAGGSSQLLLACCVTPCAYRLLLM